MKDEEKRSPGEPLAGAPGVSHGHFCTSWKGEKGRQFQLLKIIFYET
jgi:hypothetical protein